MRNGKTDPATLYYRETGSGPPLLLIHGLLGSCATMGRLARGLARAFTVLTVDLRNHGRSFHASGMTYRQMAEDLVRVMDDAQLGSAGVAGHSMGGKCAMQLAMNYPYRVSKLAVLDMAPKAYDPLWQPWIQAMLAMDLSYVTHRKEADGLLAAAVPEIDFRQFLLQNLKRLGNRRFSWRANLPAIRDAMPAICAPVSGRPYPNPTLFIRGSQSDYLSETDWIQIRQLFPNAALDTIFGADHLLHLTHPDRVIRRLSHFFMKGDHDT